MFPDVKPSHFAGRWNRTQDLPFWCFIANPFLPSTFSSPTPPPPPILLPPQFPLLLTIRPWVRGCSKLVPRAIRSIRNPRTALGTRSRALATTESVRKANGTLPTLTCAKLPLFSDRCSVQVISAAALHQGLWFGEQKSSKRKRYQALTVFVRGTMAQDNTAELRFSVVRSPRFWVSGYCTKWRIQGQFW